MKDLDFDELDKAVNSLMTAGGKKPEDSTDTPKTETPAVDSTASATSTDDTVTSETEPVSVGTPETEVSPEPAIEPVVEPSAPVSKPTPAVKRRGQFMDVVHPSSDMRTANKPSAPRVGVTIAPPAPAAPAATPETSASTESVPETPAAPTEEVSSAPSTDMPDPIDMHESRLADTTDTPVTPEPVEDTPPAPEPSPVSESPFLSDAQVEKRPLGAAAPTGGMPNSTPEVASDAPVVSTEEPADSESAESSKSEVATTEATQMSTDPIVSKVEPIKESLPPSAIAQQYKEQESTGDKEHTGLYDAAAVNVPLIHPAKERSGWLWVIWTLLLILVGALGAATLWYFKII